MGRFRLKPAAAARLAIIGGGLAIVACLALVVGVLAVPILGVATALGVGGAGSIAYGLIFIDVDRG